ncbi:lysoplasmalogenase [Treponema sp. OttesenSCG-928-L16]|nr:lysoplasmalogenase [Treponema sp. OttesenSCG-928-L16]
MLTAKIVLLLFIAVSLMHLYAAFFQREKLRKITKGFLLPLLLVLYILRAEHVLPAVIFAAVFGWIGDILLIRIDKPYHFPLGLASFLLGHVCYILTMFIVTKSFHVPAFIVSFAAAVPLWFGVLKFIKAPENMRIPTSVYAAVIELMSLAALQLMIYRMDPAGILIFAGSILFIMSDSILAYFTFRTLPKYGNFWIMLFYIAAQSCILLGLSQY